MCSYDQNDDIQDFPTYSCVDLHISQDQEIDVLNSYMTVEASKKTHPIEMDNVESEDLLKSTAGEPMTTVETATSLIITETLNSEQTFLENRLHQKVGTLTLHPDVIGEKHYELPQGAKDKLFMPRNSISRT